MPLAHATCTIYSSTMAITREQFDAIPLIELISQKRIDKIHLRAKEEILSAREYMAPHSRRVNLRYAVVCLTRARVNIVREKIYTAIMVAAAVEKARLHQSTHVWRQLARERNQDHDHDQDVSKSEQTPLFAQENSVAWSYGMPSTTDYMQSRQLEIKSSR
jgi:hypothetical protein